VPVDHARAFVDTVKSFDKARFEKEKVAG